MVGLLQDARRFNNLRLFPGAAYFNGDMQKVQKRVSNFRQYLGPAFEPFSLFDLFRRRHYCQQLERLKPNYRLLLRGMQETQRLHQKVGVFQTT